MTNNNNGRATVGAILAASILSAIGIACWNLLPVTLGAAADTYSLSDQQMGLLGSSLLAGWLLATVPAFFYMHKVNRRWVTLVGAVVAAAGSIGSLLTTVINWVYLAWMVAGFGMALVYCVSIQLIAELGDIERSFGYKLVSEVSGAAILLYVFPAFIISVWHYAGASYGVAIVYLAAIAFLYWVTPFQPQQNTQQSEPGGAAPIGAWLALFGFLVFFSGVTGLWAFLERIGTDMGIPAQDIGILFAIIKVVGGIAGLTVVFASSKYGIRWPHTVAFLCIIIGVAILQFADSTTAYAAGTWIWEYGFSLGASYQFAAIARLDTSNRLLLLIPSCIGLGGMIGPAAAGYLKQGESYGNVYLFAALCALVSVVIFLTVLSKKRLHALAIN